MQSKRADFWYEIIKDINNSYHLCVKYPQRSLKFMYLKPISFIDYKFKLTFLNSF